MDKDSQTLALLQTLDRLPGPDHLEFPDGFDYASAKNRAIRLEDRLTQDFGHVCGLDDQIQDASYSFQVAIPAEATEADVPAYVRLSNFGNLAVAFAPRPDSHDDLDQAVQKGALTTADRSRIESAAHDFGYTLVPPRLLHRPYDGVTWLAGGRPFHASYGPHRSRATWWTRYFEYV